MKIYIPNLPLVLETHRRICVRDRSPIPCLDVGKIESALAAAFYPGSPPFVHGGVARTAGALCFYLTKAHAFMDANKRTALAVSAVFLQLNGWRLKYPVTDIHNTLSDLIEKCAASELSKDDVMEWFENHKVSLEDRQ